MERVLPCAEIKPRIAALTIGLAANCDDPEQAVAELMHDKLPGASTLPFVGFLTCDGKWVTGFSGYKDAAGFAAVLAEVEKSPLLDATPAVQKQLEKLAPKATAAAEHADWKGVLAVCKQAASSTGRCPEREAIKAAEQRARKWAEEQFAAVVADSSAGADLAPSRRRLAEVKRHFAGEPEAVEAEAGAKAVLRLTQIRDAETLPNAAKDLREKAAAMWKDSRWAAVFSKAEVKDAAKEPEAGKE